MGAIQGDAKQIPAKELWEWARKEREKKEKLQADLVKAGEMNWNHRIASCGKKRGGLRGRRSGDGAAGAD